MKIRPVLTTILVEKLTVALPFNISPHTVITEGEFLFNDDLYLRVFSVIRRGRGKEKVVVAYLMHRSMPGKP
jgi:hypothetical protein